jgi:hypothetical protein
VTAIREKIDKVDLAAPNVPPAIWMWAVGAVRKEEDEPAKVDASSVDRGLKQRLKRLADRLIR